MITVDKNLQYQQSLTGRTISIITLNALFGDYKGIAPLAPQVLQTLDYVVQGSFITISSI